MTIAKKAILPLLILVLVATAGVVLLRGGDDTKTLTAHFPRAISVYEGSDVKVLGVGVGTVDSVTPSGTDVVVTMHYDEEVDIPVDAQAVIIAPSIVGDRFIQLTPAYSGDGEVMEDGVTLTVEQTSVPLELDQIYSSLNELNVALGPEGANRNGALTDLLETTAANFGGQGEEFHRTIEQFSALSATLDDNKEELFGSAAELEAFISTLAKNDATVRRFNQSLADVSTLLSGEREELAASLQNLSIGLGEVARFVADNKALLSRNIKGINRVAKVLVKQRNALEETLSVAPVALNNLALTYNPQSGTLDTNANIPQSLEQDPSALVCGFLGQVDPSGGLCDLAQTALPRAGFMGAGTGSSYDEAFDPTLGGLVEVDR